MKTAVLAVLLSTAAAAETIAVRDLRVQLTGAGRAAVDGAALADRIRDVTRRTAPDAQLGENADFVIGGEVTRIEQGFLASLELRQGGKLVATESAIGSTPEELADGVEGATVDLLRARKPAASRIVAPEPPAKLTDEPDLDADANAIVALDHAKQTEESGAEHPQEAAETWRAVAQERGRNPYVDLALARALLWESYAETKRAFDDGLARDSARLQKLLPLASVKNEAKLELLVRHARTYGPDRAAFLVAFLPLPLQETAGLALGCEQKNGAQCVAMAERTDDPVQKADWYDRGCTAGENDACAEAGERLLRQNARDVPRALGALQRGCSALSARSCARLARVYEEGDGTDVNVLLAAELRNQACVGGDGMSCRRLACTASDTALAESLWEKGCARGDQVSCTLARMSAPPPPPAVTSAPAAAVATEAPAKFSGKRMAGVALVTAGVVAASGALVVAFAEPDGSNRYGAIDGRRLMVDARHDDPRGSNKFAMLLGAGAVVSATTGFILIGSADADDTPKLTISGGPGAVLLSGTLP